MGCCPSRHGCQSDGQPVDPAKVPSPSPELSEEDKSLPKICAKDALFKVPSGRPHSPREACPPVEKELTPRKEATPKLKKEKSVVVKPPPPPPPPPVVEVKPLRAKSILPLTSRAVHPLFLDALAQMEVEFPDKKVKINDMYTYEVVKDYIRPATAASGVSLIETMWEVENGCATYDGQGVQGILNKYKSCVGGHFPLGAVVATPKPYCGAVHYFLSHAWSYRFGHLKDMVKQHYETVTGSEHKYTPVYYWIDIFAVAQNFEGDFKRHPDGDFPAVIRQSQAVVFTIYPWQEPIAPTRIWCLFEALTAVDLNVSLELLLDAQFKKEKGAVLSLEQRFMSTVVGALDVRNAEATVETDRLQIMDMLKCRKGGIEAFNKLMKQMLKTRMLEALLMKVITSHGTDGGKQIVGEGATFHNRQLRFKFGRVSDGALELISQALIGNTSVTSLDLTPPSQKGIITHRGAQVLADAMKKNNVLTELDLSYNNEIGDMGVVALAQALTAPRKPTKALGVRNGMRPAAKVVDDPENSICVLQSLKLCKVGLEDRGIDALAEMLIGNVTLTSLDISQNSDASAESLEDFLKAIQTNKSLKSLNLSGLNFGPTSSSTFKALPDMIENNSSLESLSLCACHLNPRACARVAEAVGKSNIKYLDVTSNLFGESAVEVLADALTKNVGLRELRLRSCEINAEDAAHLRVALGRSGVEKVDLTGNLFGKDQWEAMGKGYNKLAATIKIESSKTGLGLAPIEAF